MVKVKTPSNMRVFRLKSVDLTHIILKSIAKYSTLDEGCVKKAYGCGPRICYIL